MRRIYEWMIRALQRCCDHRDAEKDILEGCAGKYTVTWCRVCGAHKVRVNNDEPFWSVPQPDLWWGRKRGGPPVR